MVGWSRDKEFFYFSQTEPSNRLVITGPGGGLIMPPTANSGKVYAAKGGVRFGVVKWCDNIVILEEKSVEGVGCNGYL